MQDLISQTDFLFLFVLIVTTWNAALRLKIFKIQEGHCLINPKLAIISQSPGGTQTDRQLLQASVRGSA